MINLVFVVAVYRAPALAEPPLPKAKSVPRMQAVPLPYDQVSFQRDGEEIARYHYGPTLRRPFVFPVIGPAGRSLTRMGHPHDPVTHSHHNSVWIAHNDVNGIDFWADAKGRGRIVHERVQRLDDGDETAAVLAQNAWISPDGTRVMREWRQVSVARLPEREWLLIVDLQFHAEGGDVVLGKTPFGMIGVRMAKTIGVSDGGGMVRNSEGQVNEAEAFRKRATWVDYAGRIAGDTVEGITLMDHPANPNHPAFFHVRNDGWMGACLTLDGPRSVAPSSPLRLRYGLYIHAGLPAPAAITKQWEAFAARPLPTLGKPEK